MPKVKVKVGISSCLLGEKVRYDGGDKLSRLCADELARYFDFVSICPEVGIGLGVPRQPIHLVEAPDSPRAVGVEDSALDVTRPLREYALERFAEIAGLCGYIFMENSPSCGLFGTKVYGRDGELRETAGRGIFAQAVTGAHPSLPVEEAGRLLDPAVREDFIARVFARHRRLAGKLVQASE